MKRKGSALSVALCVATVLLIAYAVGACLQYPARSASVKPAVAQEPPPSFRLNEVVRLQGTHGGEVWFFVSPDIGAVGEGLSLVYDQARLQNLVDAEALWAQPGGGTAKIVALLTDPTFIRERLGNNSDWVRVRRLDGPHKGTCGWVNARSLTR